MFNTNRWNQIRYTIYTPLYDRIGRLFTSSRRRAIARLPLAPGSRVLLVGGGTGLDLELLPPHCRIDATDLTPAMVVAMQKRATALGLQATCQQMDGQQLRFADNTFDAVLLHLIVAVLPDPLRCLQEAERVLKPGGSISLFDKFLPQHQRPSLFRRGAGAIASFLFSDLNRSFEPLLAQTGLRLEKDEAADFGGNYRILILTKPLQVGAGCK